MNEERFDRLTRIVGSSGSRRAFVRVAVGGLLAGVLGAAAVEPGAAALKQNGRPCRRGSQCLSGLCKGRRGEKRCRRAPNQGICTVESNAGGQPPTRTDCAVAGSSERCLCWVTTTGRSFCGEAAPEACGCGANNDCANVPGAVCVENRPGAFAGCGIACVLPCRFPQ